LASNTKRFSHLEAAAEEDRMVEGDRTVVVELELGSSDKMISEIPKSYIQSVEVVLKLGLLIIDLLVLL
jgi:hypothetical protein